MNVRGWLLVGLALSLAGCPNKDTKESADDSKKSDKSDKSDDKKSAAPASTGETPPKTANTPPPVTTETAPVPAGIEPRVKAELNDRADGIEGKPIAAAGARATINGPKDWAPPAGDPAVTKSKDDKARLAVTGVVGDPMTKMQPLSTAAGLSACEFGPAEQVNLGKDKIPGAAADGVCSRGAGKVKAAYMAADGLLVLGSWDADGDSATVFGAMRSVAKAKGGVDEIGACCAALAQNAKSAPPQQVPMYMMAAGTCNNLRSNPQGRAALGQVRAALAGANVPAACR
jgi:hypothetical protein